MTHRARRLLALSLLPLALGGAVAGCGSDATDTDATAQTPATGGATDAAAATTPEQSDDMSGMDHGADHGSDQEKNGSSKSSGADSGSAKSDAAVVKKATEASKSVSDRSVDAAFLRQMIPHHEMAITMAKKAVRRAEHPQLKGLATAIIRAQAVEVKTLEGIGEGLKIKTSPSASEDAMGDDAKILGVSMDAMGMSGDTSKLEDAKPFDPAFLDEMIPHHEGAIRMAKAELAKGDNPQLKRLAAMIVTSQSAELAQMNTWKADWS